MAESNNYGERRNAGALTVEIMNILGDLLLLLIQLIWIGIESIVKLFIPKTAKSVKGEIVLVTGAGHGIGKELAILYASLGSTVIIWEINEENGLKTAKEIESRNYPRAYVYKCDVSDRQQVLDLAKKVQKDVGDVSILINNAGIMPTHPLLDHSSAEIQKIMDINVMAHFWTLEAFLPAMKRNNYGHIVCLSSTAGLFGVNNLVPYCTSKFAVRGMMEALYQELRMSDRNNEIQLTSIYPFMVDTGLCKKPIIRFKNLMKLVHPKDLAEAIVDAQRKNIRHRSVPAYYLGLEALFKLMPIKSSEKLFDFAQVGVDSDL